MTVYCDPVAGKTLVPGSVICLTNARWNSPWWIDRHYLMGGLAKLGWPVFWSTGPMKLWERGSIRWQNARYFGDFRAEPDHGILVDRPGKAAAAWARILNDDNSEIRDHALRLQKAVSRQPRPLIAFVCYPDFLPYLDVLNPDHIVLHINDKWRDSSVWTAELDRLYLELADRADLITTLAASMVRDLEDKYSQKIQIVDQAVYAQDYINGSALPCPEDLAGIPHPRLGYIGRVSQKVDLALVLEISMRCPDWQWVFVGQVGFGFSDVPEMKTLLAQCEERPNIHFLGARDQHLMPAYMGHMDVNTMCYKTRGGYWAAGNPLKQLEYLAAGKPIVGARIENSERYSHAIGLADTVDEWVAQLDHAINRGGQGSVSDRHTIALANTWQARIKDLDGWFRDMGATSFETENPDQTLETNSPTEQVGVKGHAIERGRPRT